MPSLFRACWLKLKRKLRRPKSQPKNPTTVVRSLSPEPLPVILQRERALSVIFDTGLQLASKDSQPTFLLLPYELRRQIVEYCICGIAVHLNVSETGGRIEQIIYINPSDVVRKQKVLAISLTCRQLYLETINLIYAGNKFRMSMVLTVLALPGKIPSQRLNALNDLWFYWHVRQPPSESTAERRQWSRVWHILASLEGLKRLRVQIFPFFVWEDDWPHEEKRLMEDAKFVTRPSTFEVELAWSEGQTPLHLPCIVTRIPNDG